MSMTIIGKTVFDLRVGSVEGGRAAQSTVSQFSREHLAAVLDTALDGFGDGPQLRRFDRIELQLGEISAAALAQQLEERIGVALRDFVRRQPSWRRHVAQVPPPDAEQGDMWGSLRAFLDGAPCEQIAKLMPAALANWPEQTIALVRDMGNKQRVRQRMARALPAPVLEQLVRRLEPEQAHFIIDYVADVNRSHHQRPLVPEGRRDFQAVLWELVLAYLLLERGSYFNTRSMVGQTLAAMAGRYRIAYADLLASLAAATSRLALPDSRRYGLATILHDLQSAQCDPASAPAPVPAARQRCLVGIAMFLQRGVLPWPEREAAHGGIGGLLATALDQTPDQLLVLLRRMGGQQSVRQRLANQLAEPMLARLVALIEPQHAPWIVGTVATVRQVQARQLLVQEDTARFTRRLWEFVLLALLVERGSYFNTRSFIKTLLQRMAAASGIGYQHWLQALIGHGLRQSPSARKPLLANVLLTLQREQELADARTVAPSPAQLPQLRLALRSFVLRTVLAGANLPHERRELTAALVRRMARRYRLPERQLIDELLAHGDGLTPILGRHTAVASILVSLHEELVSVHTQQAAVAMPVEYRAPANFARAAREFAVRSLLVERGSYFNDRSYIQSLVRQLSARHGIAVDQLLQGLIIQAGALVRTARPSSVPAILLALKADASAAGGRVPVPARHPSAPARVAPGEADLAWQFLLHGNVPHDALESMPARLARLLRKGPHWRSKAQLMAALRNGAQRADIIERMLDYMPRRQLVRLLGWLSPAYAGLLDTLLLAAVGWQPSASVDIGRAHWQIVLEQLLDPGHRGQSLATQLSTLGATLCQRAGLEAGQYWATMLALARKGQHPRYMALADLCEQQLRRLGLPPDAAAPYSAPLRAGQDAQSLAHALVLALRQGLTMAEAYARLSGQSLDEDRLEALLIASMRKHPQVFRAPLLASAGRLLERLRMVSVLTPALREQILSVLGARQYVQTRWWQSALAHLLATMAPAARSYPWAALLADEMLQALYRAGGGRVDMPRYLDAVIRRAAPQVPAAVLIAALRTELAQRPPQHRRAAERLLALVERTPAPKSATPPEQPDELLADEAQEWEVANAGLVIAWPFIDRYFQTLGLTEDGNFVDPAAQSRAVHLLQYLVTGQLDAPEHELLLNKILCGMAQTDALEVAGPLSDQERDLSSGLLGALIAHWGKLGSTDAAGLQETFMQRSGRLKQKDGNWTLNVDVRAFDVLMSALPWSLATIRLSWMKAMLWVSWK